MSLRKIIVVLILILITHFTINAQDFEYGIEGGLGVSAIHMSDVPKGISYTRMYTPIPIYSINAFISYKSKNFWGLSVEPGIIQKGGIQLFDSRNSKHQIIHNNVFVVMHYIQLPILVNAYLGKRFYFLVGPELAYRLSESTGTTNTLNNTDMSVTAYESLGNNVVADNILPDEKRRFEISGVLGINYCVNKKFDLGLRYSYGFNNLVDVTWVDKLGYLLGHSSTHNQYLQVLFKFKI